MTTKLALYDADSDTTLDLFAAPYLVLEQTLDIFESADDEVAFTVEVEGTSGDNLAERVRALRRQILRAERADLDNAVPRVRLDFALSTTNTVYADLVGGRVTTLADAIRGAWTENGSRTWLDVVVKTALHGEFRGAQISVSNLMTYSEDFASWPTLTGTTVSADALVGPDRSVSEADKINETGATSAHHVTQNNIATGIGTTYTASVWLKSGERSNPGLLLLSSGGSTLASAQFDLNTGSITSNSAGTAGIEAWPNGWYRCWVTAAATTTTSQVRIFPGAMGSFTGTNGSGVYAWGAQLEAASVPGVYRAVGSTARLNGATNNVLRLFAIPGDGRALPVMTITDQSTSGQINRLRFAHRGRADNFAFWYMTSATGSGVNTADTTGIGSALSRLTTSSTTPTKFAGASDASGTTAAGRYDILARIKDSATALAAPTSPNDVALGKLPRPVQSNVASGAGSDTTIALPSWPAATTEGNTLVLLVRSSSAGKPSSVPSGYRFVDEAGTAPALRVYIKPNAASESGSPGSVTWGSGNTNRWAALIELEGIVQAEDVLLDVVSGTFVGATAASNGVAMSLGSETEDVPSLSLLVAAYNATTNDAWSGTGDELIDSFGVRVDTQRHSAATTAKRRISWSGSSVAGDYPYELLAFAARSTPEASERQLRYGSYQWRVRAIDETGTPGNACATQTISVPSDYNALALDWVAPSGNVSLYEVTVKYKNVFYRFFTSDATASLTINDLAEGEVVSGFPDTSGAAGPPARLDVYVGSKFGDKTLLVEGVVLTGAADWRIVRLAAGVDLPPSLLDASGTREGWGVELYAYSTNGLQVVVDSNALFLMPSEEAQLVAESLSLAIAGDRVIRLETDFTGRATVTRTTDPTNFDIPSETYRPFGALRLDPWKAQIGFCVEQASGAANLAATEFDLALSIFPVHRFQGGDE